MYANPEQKRILDIMFEIAYCDDNNEKNCHFIDSPAGTDKYLYWMLLEQKWFEIYTKCIAMVVSTAISTQQMKYNTTTVHYKFKLPTFLDANDVSAGFEREEEEYINLKHVKVLIWDGVLTIRK